MTGAARTCDRAALNANSNTLRLKNRIPLRRGGSASAQIESGPREDPRSVCEPASGALRSLFLVSEADSMSASAVMTRAVVAAGCSLHTGSPSGASWPTVRSAWPYISARESCTACSLAVANASSSPAVAPARRGLRATPSAATRAASRLAGRARPREEAVTWQAETVHTGDALYGRLEVDDDAVAEVAPVLGARHDSAAGGHHHAPIGRNLVEHRSLHITKALFAVSFEDLGHALPRRSNH